uniref:Uncharacterized protein n=1 Tax=uncultured marine group II/III euryarchaeote KM3_85_D06 TaxID=1456528 RepID=A0A075HZ94_9EURY|nr:hypothetical protein [uncultured marine group II/III euryarchaeote KM3_85_D06]
MLVLGLLMLVIGVVMTVGGVGKGAGDLAELADYEFSVENATSGTIEIVDNDGEGDFGVSFWVKGEYVDEDENGIWDVCDDTNITITQHPEVNTKFDEEGKNNTLGEFYYEVLDGFDGCEAEQLNKEDILYSEGFVKVGRACLGCYAGTLEFESNVTVYVSYDDPWLEQLGEGLLALLGGTIGGSACCCCGGVIAIIGLILGIALKSPEQQMAMAPGVAPAQQAAFAQQPPANDFQQGEPPR